MKFIHALPLVAVAFAAGCATIDRPSHETLIAHRGESKDAPENTLPAYKLAVERGFGFECDLYLSKDGRVFTFHDSTLTRTTGGANTNRCGDVSWAETVSKLDVGGWGKWAESSFKGTPPALLEDVLALARDGRRIYLEIKTGPEIVPAIRAVLAAQQNATPGNVLFISFNKASCAAVKDLLPDYTVYWLVTARTQGRPVTAEEVVEGARAARADGVDMQFDPDVVTEDFVAAVKKAGLSFHVWTVDTLPETLRAFAVGAQTVTTNCAKELYDEYTLLFAPQPEAHDDPFVGRAYDGAAFPMMP